MFKSLPSHKCTAMQVAWSPHQAGVLASTDVRGMVFVWDVEAAIEGGEAAAPAAAAAAAPAGLTGAAKRKQRAKPPAAAPSAATLAGRPGAGSARFALRRRPELRMINAGHLAEVNDFAWCPSAASGTGLLASVSSMWDGEEEGEEGEEDGKRGKKEGDGAEEDEDGDGDDSMWDAEEEEEGGRVSADVVQAHSVQLWRPALYPLQ